MTHRPDPAPAVRVIGWDTRSAVALVDGVRCRVRRSASGRIRWVCDEHGTEATPHCHHLAAMAATSPPPDTRRPDPKASDQ